MMEFSYDVELQITNLKEPKYLGTRHQGTTYNDKIKLLVLGVLMQRHYKLK
jgi:hypothetical protein